MARQIKTAEDLAWLLQHTHAFCGGQVTDLHVHKQRLLDEGSGREIPAGTTITIVIQYEHPSPGSDALFTVNRVAKLTLKGVTDFSVFEQEGTDFSEIGMIHAEASGGRLRFWFDPQGELYVICDEAEIEEVSRPGIGRTAPTGMTEWTFQAQAGELPEIEWFLERLDQAGFPCAWRAVKQAAPAHPALRWAGQLVPASACDLPRTSGIHVQTYGPLDGCGFGITLRIADPNQEGTARLLKVLAEIITQSFTGLCLARNQILAQDDWLWGARRGE